ncbi:MAG: glycosyltransferase family 4 protein [Candidatus Helarchaeota archaeon]
MRILFILQQIEKGGGQVIQGLKLAKYLKEKNHSIFIISDRGKIISKDMLGYFNELHIELIGNRVYNYNIIVKYLSIFFKCIKLIHSNKIDLIQVFDPHFGGLIGVLLKFIFRIPLVIRVGSKYEEFYILKLKNSNSLFRLRIILNSFQSILRLVEKISINHTNKIIANCRFISDYIKNKPYFKNYENIQIIPSGISLKKIVLKNPNFKLPAKYILYVGRIVRYKGIAELIRVFDKINNKDRNIKLILLGSTEFDKQYYKYLKNIIKNKNLDNKIIFKGAVSHSLVYTYLKHAEFLVLPSLNNKYQIDEGMPNIILEAFKMKCPVIASNVGGIREIIINNENGLSFTPGMVDELYNKMILLLENMDLREKIIKNASNYLIINRDSNKLNAKYLKIYYEIIKKE